MSHHDEFLNTIFPEVPEGESVLLGHPAPSGSGWVWLKPKQRPRSDQLYFSVGTVKVTRRGKLTRTKAAYGASCVVVLDDIGTKVPVEKMTVPPSYILETSPGNFQYGYCVEREADGPKFEALLKALAAKGCTDKGCTDRLRMMRVPGSMNRKHDGAFAAVLHEMHPDRRWTIDSLAKAYKVKLAPEPDYEQASAERAAQDPLLEWLSAGGMVIKDKGEWVNIVCPWHDAHAADPRKDAGYKPLDQDGRRAFKCQHSGCKDRHTSDFIDWAVQQGAPLGSNMLAGLGKLVAEKGIKPPPVPPQGDPETYTQWAALFPRVKKSSLPHCKRNADNQPSAKQMMTRPNVEYVIKQLGVTLRLNMLTRETEVWLPEAMRVGWWLRSDPWQQQRACRDAIRDACMLCGLDSRERVDEHMEGIASANPYHPFDEWIHSAPWDGVSRFDSLVNSVTLHSPLQSHIWKAFLRRWLLLTVRTALGYNATGYSFGNAGVLTLQGPQGCGKTSWLGSLVPPGYFKEGLALHLNGSNARDAKVEALSGSVICELGELETTFNKSDAGALKNFLSAVNHKFRLPYGREWIEWRRSTTYCASVNQSGFLNDNTGSRRFWIISVDACNARHGIDLQQLWAEVLTWHKAGEQAHLTQEEDAWREGMSEQYAQSDEAIDKTNRWLGKRPLAGTRYALTVTEIAELAGMLRPSNRTLSAVRITVENATGERTQKVGGFRRAFIMRLLPSEVSSEVTKLDHDD